MAFSCSRSCDPRKNMNRRIISLVLVPLNRIQATRYIFQKNWENCMVELKRMLPPKFVKKIKGEGGFDLS